MAILPTVAATQAMIDFMSPIDRAIVPQFHAEHG